MASSRDRFEAIRESTHRASAVSRRRRSTQDADDVKTLRKLADVAKLVVLLNEPPLVEALLDQPLFEPFLGALEYAADLKQRPDASDEDPPESPLKKDRQAAREAVAKCTNGEDESDDGLLERRNTLDSNATRRRRVVTEAVRRVF